MRLLFRLSLALLFLPFLSFSQDNSFVCHTGDVNGNQRSNEPGCWPDYDQKCERVVGFAPDEYKPEETPIKYVKVVLHIFQNSNDPTVIHPPGNFTNSTVHLDVLRSWFHHPTLGINAKLSNVCDPLPKVPGFESPHIPDARVRFLFDGIENQDVFFYDNAVLWGGGPGCSNGTSLSRFTPTAITNNFIVQNDPSILNSVHVFLPSISANIDPTDGSITCSSYSEGGFTAFSCTNNRIVLFGNYYRYMYNLTGVSTWANYQEAPDPILIPHGGNGVLAEWFHMVSVDHPNAASHLNTPVGIFDHCDDTPVGNNVNNYMGGNSQPPLLKCGLTQCQLGRAHRYMDLIKPNYIRFPFNGFQYPAPWVDCQTKDVDLIIGNNETVTWDSEKILYSNVIVENGSTLNIECDVYMSEGALITVEAGGTLVVRAKISAECNSWLGIEAKGVPSASQFSSGIQSRVYLTGATIEDAKIGVSLFRRQTYSQGGGILYATNSDFINCQKGIAIAKYTNIFPGSSTPTSNLSYISNCNFTIDDNFLLTMEENIFNWIALLV